MSCCSSFMTFSHTHIHIRTNTHSSSKVKAAPRLAAGLIKAFLEDIIPVNEGATERQELSQHFLPIPFKMKTQVIKAKCLSSS